MRSITRETIERRLCERAFMYEPSLPPTIPAGITAADWLRAQAGADAGGERVEEAGDGCADADPAGGTPVRHACALHRRRPRRRSGR